MYAVIYTTAGSKKEADKIARMLVEERLVACVNYFPIISVYSWKKKTEYGREYALLCKTLKKNFKKIKEKIKNMHSYEIPCIISLPIEKGDEDYLHWIRGSIRQT